ncbi:hypothetical protein [Adhaeribacter pallidiroseus]|uniref:Type I site-specific deoxyribonuclease n=1 Tax=Adhaeribacter pallidiroseus TaxID=2072847 RepID=A0A369QDG7_9BACT|nr:hypothetical protein [Adhaeribacter pallidiroseus]RDC62370.1 Type I site-specific deoxyribonuclease [Adhaeribacter pallidiroseus]
MKLKKTVLEILKESEKPIEAKELWQSSIHSEDIEGFYSELKNIYQYLTEIKEGTKSFLSLKK